MPRELPPDMKSRAKALYCIDGLEIADTAGRLGVSASVVRSWAEKGRWREERESLQAREAEIHVKMVEARLKALDQLLAWDDSKESAFALNVVDKLGRLSLSAARFRALSEKNRVPAKNKAMKQAADAAQAKAPDLSQEERIAFLEEGINRQIAFLLQEPVEDFSEQVRQIKAGLDVLASIRGKGECRAIKVSFDE